jgi:hypothetical protein
MRLKLNQDFERLYLMTFERDPSVLKYVHGFLTNQKCDIMYISSGLHEKIQRSPRWLSFNFTGSIVKKGSQKQNKIKIFRFLMTLLHHTS